MSEWWCHWRDGGTVCLLTGPFDGFCAEHRPCQACGETSEARRFWAARPGRSPEWLCVSFADCVGRQLIRDGVCSCPDHHVTGGSTPTAVKATDANDPSEPA